MSTTMAVILAKGRSDCGKAMGFARAQPILPAGRRRQVVGWVERPRPPKFNPAKVEAKPIEAIVTSDGFRKGSTHPTGS
jgi:hypothetical protein